jgi:hypothetical protein
LNEAPPPSPLFLRVSSAYRGAAVLLLNALVAFLVLNVLAAAVLGWRERKRRATALGSALPAHHRHVDLAAYEGTPGEEVRRMLDEFTQMRGLGFRYEPFVQFSEPPFQGQYLNVETDALGFRHRRVPGSPPDGVTADELLFFGGSTTFGYHVADGSTVPSKLQAALSAAGRPLRVRNHGHGYFYSSQEVALFLQMLRRGRRPAVAVFLDGLNDAANYATWKDTPAFTDLTRDLWSLSQSGRADDTAFELAQRWPVVRLALRLQPPDEGLAPVLGAARPERGDPAAVGREAADVYRGNVRAAQALCAAYGVACHFFVQPSPFFGHDRSRHPGFPGASAWAQSAFAAFYEELAARPGPSVFLGGMLREYGPDRKVFVDDVHYNEPFARFLAARLAQHVLSVPPPAR